MQFIPKNGGLPASGKIEEDGTFSLKSKTGEGRLLVSTRSALSRASSC